MWELVFGLVLEKRWLLYFGCILTVVYVCVYCCPHWTWELVFGLGFREKMVALLWLYSYCGVCVCLLLPPLDVGASV